MTGWAAMDQLITDPGFTREEVDRIRESILLLAPAPISYPSGLPQLAIEVLDQEEIETILNQGEGLR